METDIPVKHKNNNSTNLSITTYAVRIVKIYVKKVFLSVFKIFNNLSKYFKKIHHFHYMKIVKELMFFQKTFTYILSYKIKKKTRVLAKICINLLNFSSIFKQVLLIFE